MPSFNEKNRKREECCKKIVERGETAFKRIVPKSKIDKQKWQTIICFEIVRFKIFRKINQLEIDKKYQ